MKSNDPYFNLSNDELDSIIQNVTSWQQLKGKNIFLSGGTGFVGKWILASFIYANSSLSLGSKIYVLSRKPKEFLKQFPNLVDLNSIEFIEGDIRSFNINKNLSIDYAIHAATDVVAKRSSIDIFNDCVHGTDNLLKEIQKVNCKKLLLLSSGAVYGSTPETLDLISEEYSGSPNTMSEFSAYGEGKRVSELLSCIESESGQLSVTTARCFAFVGPYLPLDKHFAIGNFILSAMKDEKIFIRGDGTPLRSYLYSADLVLWLWELLFKGKNSTVYNVGGSEPVSIERLANKVVQSLNSSSLIEISTPKDKNKPVQKYIPDIQRIYNDLGLKPIFDLESSIQRTAIFNKDLIT